MTLKAGKDSNKGQEDTAPAKALFCIHAIGGEVLGYTKLAQQIRGPIAVYGLQAQGFVEQQLPLSDIGCLFYTSDAADETDRVTLVGS